LQTVLQQKQQAEATLISFTKRLNTSAAAAGAASKPDVNPFLAPPAVEASSTVEEHLGLAADTGIAGTVAGAAAAGGSGRQGGGMLEGLREAAEGEAGEGVAPSAQHAFSGLLGAAAAASGAGGGRGDAAEAAADGSGEVGGVGGAGGAEGVIGWKEVDHQQQQQQQLQEQAALLVGGAKPLGFTFNPLAAQQRLAVGIAGSSGGFVDAFEEKMVKEGLAGGMKRGRGAVKYTEAELRMFTAEEIFRESEAAQQRGAVGAQSGRGAKREVAGAGVAGGDVEFMEIGEDEGGNL
jgi:hypothetical protein